MIRITLIVAAFIVVIGIAVRFWIIRDPSGTPHSEPGAAAPQQFDTTVGQQMRPRWNLGERQGDDATNK